MTAPVHTVKIILSVSMKLHGFNSGKSHLLSQGTLEVDQNNCSSIHIVALGMPEDSTSVEPVFKEEGPQVALDCYS